MRSTPVTLVLEPIIGFLACLVCGVAVIKELHLSEDNARIVRVLTPLIALVVAFFIHNWHFNRLFHPPNDEDDW